MKPKVLLFIFNGYCEFEIASAISMLRDTHDLHTFSLKKLPCYSEAGLITMPNFSIDEINPNKYEILIIPGGDLKPIANAEELFVLVNNFFNLGKNIAAICSGVYVLAKAGVLNNLSYTVTLSKEQRNFLGVFDERNYRYKEIVIQENVITAQGHAYVEFGIQVAKMVRETSTEIIEFYRGERNRLMEADE
ncbi:DJ-1/PfpI family protein [Cytobacillus massiliigabonensis]|uniref:DJ-1/PfpI family protein n=1 Tax=Cytobacillus massiliigabonensis TaxID=1871011 RepID=UPI000C820376|nr:DJ-1/PfpI family protein [Cytobacillus massiliigabonensis]